jgi:hypothetical protein
MLVVEVVVRSWLMETQEQVEDDADSALLVLNLADDMRRKGSDRLTQLPTIAPAPTFDDVYVVCGVRPWPPSPGDVDDLAVRLSNLLEDLHRLHVDRRHRDADAVGMLCVPMGLPIVHRAHLREARLAPGYDWLSPPPPERELCVLVMLVIPRWVGATRDIQLGQIDAAARAHGLRCVEPGVIPQDE